MIIMMIIMCKDYYDYYVQRFIYLKSINNILYYSIFIYVIFYIIFYIRNINSMGFGAKLCFTSRRSYLAANLLCNYLAISIYLCTCAALYTLYTRVVSDAHKTCESLTRMCTHFIEIQYSRKTRGVSPLSIFKDNRKS